MKVYITRITWTDDVTAIFGVYATAEGARAAQDGRAIRDHGVSHEWSRAGSGWVTPGKSDNERLITITEWGVHE